MARRIAASPVLRQIGLGWTILATLAIIVNTIRLAVNARRGEIEIMRFATELVDAGEYTFPAASLVRPQELAMAEQLIANLAEPFDPSKYKDEYEEKLRALLKAKLKGKKLPDEDVEKPEKTKVIDLVARLQESLESTTPRKRSARKAPARKTTRAKSARKRRAS